MIRPFMPALLAAALLPAGASAQQVQPGQWEIVTTVRAADLPNGVKADVGKSTTVRSCLTAAEAVKGPKEMLQGNKQCRMNRYVKKDGKLDSQMVCTQGPSTMTATTKGVFTSTSFSNQAQMVMTGPQKMTMNVTSVGKRIGACGK